MNRKLLFLPIFVLSLFLVSSVAQADVARQDAQVNNQFSNELSFTSGLISTGSGNTGDYELIACGTVVPISSNPFSQPSPNGWSELDNANCGGAFTCRQGIWGRFTDTANSEDISCNWTDSTFVFGAGSFRYSEVANDPIIDIACNTGTTSGSMNPVLAPSINTEAGSHVVIINTYTSNDQPPFGNEAFVNALGEFALFSATAANTFQHVVSRGQTIFTEEAGPTGEFNLTPLVSTTGWRACTLALRMAPRQIPTMSEWGLISFAAFAGIAGFWFMRRRQVAASN